MTDRSRPLPFHEIDPLSLRRITPSRTILGNGVPLEIFASSTGDDSGLIDLSIVIEGGDAESSTPFLPMIAAGLMTRANDEMSAPVLADFLERHGARLGVSTSPHHTTVNLRALARNFANVLPAITRCLVAPTMPQDELDKTLRTLSASIALRSRDPEYVASTNARPRVFGPSHPLAQIPTLQTVGSISRDSLMSFYASHGINSRTHLLMAGQIGESDLKAVEEHLGALTLSGDESSIRLMPFAAQKGGRDSLEYFAVEGAQQSSLDISLPLPARSDSRFIPLRLAAAALGGYFGSRLNLRIREQLGLTYGIEAHIEGYREGSILNISSSFDTSNLDRVIDETFDQIRQLHETPPTDVELSRLRRHLTASLTGACENPFAAKSAAVGYIVNGSDNDYFERQCQAIADLTPEYISQAASMFANFSGLILTAAGG